MDRGLGDDAVVLGVPRGGVIVARAVADELGLPLDVALARKLGAPRNPELAIGAIAEGGDVWLNDELIRRLGPDPAWLASVISRETEELERRARRYRPGGPHPIGGMTAIVVDDGVATGATLAAVLKATAVRRPARLICAVPVGPNDSLEMLAAHCDEVVCPLRPRRFGAVGEWYDDFSQTADHEVVAALSGT